MNKLLQWGLIFPSVLCSIIAFGETPTPFVIESGSYEIEVTPLENGEFLVNQYPELSAGQLEVTGIKSFSLGSESQEICQRVERLLQLLEKPWVSSASKARYIESIRRLNQFDLSLELVTGLLPQQIVAALQESTQTSPVFITNPLTLSQLHLQFVKETHSLSDAIGFPDSLTAKLEEPKLASVYLIGHAAISISQADVYCDLLAGRIRISGTLKTSYQGADHALMEQMHDIELISPNPAPAEPNL